MKKFYFDIETEGLPFEQIERLMPEFEAAANIKDEVKIKAAIEAKKADWLDKVALKAITGKIVAVTIAKDDNVPEMWANFGEKTLIEEILKELKSVISLNAQAYAWNGSGFDLPFICQRAAVYNIPAFADLTVNMRGRFYWQESLIDPKLVWSNYSPDHTGTSLKSVALALGVGEKTGEGKDFAKLLKEKPDEAKTYALNDVNLLRTIVRRMGI
jgi:predicted PolB exonuclease-like 3'-5' exonuclease